MDKLVIKKTNLKDLIIVRTPTFFEDYRGLYIESYNKKLYKNSGIDIEFVADEFIISDKNVLRGIHGDQTTWKLVSCMLGKFYIVIVNCDTFNKDFGKWQSFILTENNKKQLLVPPKYGIVHLALSKKIVYHYKQSTYYEDKQEFVYRWDDPYFNILWPIKNPILSEKDMNAVLISE
jgi:dTDP-4-dehydrorhamnose 3,5-epimerase|tara:strand:- start:907 stop:1437 length:531 start_codon:yes stop_codon:yes gene_type:complete